MARGGVSRKAAARPGGADGAAPALDARQRQDMLAEALSGWSPGAERPCPAPTPETPRGTPDPAPASSPAQGPGLLAALARRRGQLLKTLAAAAVAFYFGWVPAQRLIAVSSTEAVVNARLVTLRSPIEGDVAQGVRPLELGAAFEAGEAVVQVANARLDLAALNLLLRARGQIEATLTAARAKRDSLAQRREALALQQEAFRQARIRQISARVEETQAQTEALAARRVEFRAALERARTLLAKGSGTRATVEKAESEASANAAEIAALDARARGLAVERDAARAGLFVGDSYNDTPHSAQRGGEMEIELAELDARLRGGAQEIATLDAAIAAERRRLADLADLAGATVTTAVQGRVWEMLTAPGEHVSKGQDLLRLVDCSAAIVTASLSERAYARLQVGQRATFRPREGGREFEGRVIALNGPTAVTANSAIPQQNLKRDVFHASVKAPGLSDAGQCGLGRTGVVTFDASTPPPAP